MAATEQVILVNKHDQPTGTAEKLIAHQQGMCHRAFSVLIFRKTPTIEVLIQQRAKGKYHSPNLWTNTCCSHPRPGEETVTAAKRRLHEELGLTIELTPIGRFHYIAHFDNGLTENEVDHVIIGEYQHESITPNPDEIQAYRWINLDQLKHELASCPQQFTPWFWQVLDIFEQNLNN